MGEYISMLRLGFWSVLIFVAATGSSSGSSFGSTFEKLTLKTYDGVSLSARIDYPEQGEVKGVALILHGSGSVGIDGDVSGPFLGSGYRGGSTKLHNQITSYLTSAGLGVFRYAKRGAEDPSQVPNQTISNLAQDARSALSEIYQRFPGSKVVLVGFSEGAIVSTILAGSENLNGVFLLSLPTVRIDRSFNYQFIEWPVELLRTKLDQNHDGMLSVAELASAGKDFKLPHLGVEPLKIDSNGDGALDLTAEVTVAYEDFFKQLRGLLETPQFKNWYQSLMELPSFADRAKDMHSSVYVYQAKDDAQVKFSDTMGDINFVPGLKRIRRYSELGHCFSPMDGVIGEIKTAGPMSSSVVADLVSDIKAELKF